MNEQVLELIRQLADTLGQTTAYLWPKAVLYTWALALASLVLLLILIPTLAYGIIRGLQAFVRANTPDEQGRHRHDYHDDTPYLMGAFVCGGLLLIALVFLPQTFAALVSPEGALVLDILK